MNSVLRFWSKQTCPSKLVLTLSKLLLTLGQTIPNFCLLKCEGPLSVIWEWNRVRGETHHRQSQWPRSSCVVPQCSWPRRCSCLCRPDGLVWWWDYGRRWWRNWGQSWGRSAPRFSATPPGDIHRGKHFTASIWLKRMKNALYGLRSYSCSGHLPSDWGRLTLADVSQKRQGARWVD